MLVMFILSVYIRPVLPHKYSQTRRLKAYSNTVEEEELLAQMGDDALLKPETC
jgi:hypothetical protein